jgi:D-alanine transfer protein
LKKVVAFLTALVLFLLTAISIDIFVDRKLDFNNHKFGTWVNDDKFFSHEAITSNLDKDSIVVFGSSEFSHGKKTKYHPENMFQEEKFNIMAIGAGYYQSLSHAITLSSISDGMKENKVALILSPQWFRNTGVLREAYASRFSENNFIKMLENDKLSNETKEYMIKRTEELLEKDEPTLNRVKLYEKVLYENKGSIKDDIFFGIYNKFLEEKSKTSVLLSASKEGIKKQNKVLGEDKEMLWNSYLKEAEKDGEKEASHNEFYVSDKYYKKYMIKKLKKKKDSALNNSYCTSPEYDDLKCFLDVCKELDIKPLLISIPVNGRWYDYTGFPKEDREKYYDNIRKIAKEYNVELKDLSKDEYTKYFFEDNVHIGWKGWVKVNESIYEFKKENF